MIEMTLAASSTTSIAMSNSNFLDVSLDVVQWLTMQKAIAIVSKAIEEDVKQNYVVGLSSRCRLMARKRTGSIRMRSTTL